MAGTTYMRSWQDFDMVSLALMPLFLFSATFYPLDGVPRVAPSRGPLHAALPGCGPAAGTGRGVLSWSLLGHAAYLVTAGCLGLVVATRRMAALLLP